MKTSFSAESSFSISPHRLLALQHCEQVRDTLHPRDSSHCRKRFPEGTSGIEPQATCGADFLRGWVKVATKQAGVNDNILLRPAAGSHRPHHMLYVEEINIFVHHYY